MEVYLFFADSNSTHTTSLPSTDYLSRSLKILLRSMTDIFCRASPSGKKKKKIEKRVAKRHQPNQAASMLTESWVSDIVSPWKRWKEKRRERHGAQGQLQLDNRNRLGCLSSSKQRTRKLRDYRYLLEYVHTITVTIIISVSHLLSKWKGQISKT